MIICVDVNHSAGITYFLGIRFGHLARDVMDVMDVMEKMEKMEEMELRGQLVIQQ